MPDSLIVSFFYDDSFLSLLAIKRQWLGDLGSLFEGEMGGGGGGVKNLSRFSRTRKTTWEVSKDADFENKKPLAKFVVVVCPITKLSSQSVLSIISKVSLVQTLSIS